MNSLIIAVRPAVPPHVRHSEASGLRKEEGYRPGPPPPFSRGKAEPPVRFVLRRDGSKGAVAAGPDEKRDSVLVLRREASWSRLAGEDADHVVDGLYAREVVGGEPELSVALELRDQIDEVD